MNENNCTCSPENNEQCLVHKKRMQRNLWKEDEQIGEDETGEQRFRESKYTEETKIYK